MTRNITKKYDGMPPRRKIKKRYHEVNSIYLPRYNMRYRNRRPALRHISERFLRSLSKESPPVSRGPRADAQPNGNKKKIEEFTAQLLLYRTNIDRKIAENNFESKLNDLAEECRNFLATKVLIEKIEDKLRSCMITFFRNTMRSLWSPFFKEGMVTHNTFESAVHRKSGGTLHTKRYKTPFSNFVGNNRDLNDLDESKQDELIKVFVYGTSSFGFNHEFDREFFTPWSASFNLESDLSIQHMRSLFEAFFKFYETHSHIFMKFGKFLTAARNLRNNSSHQLCLQPGRYNDLKTKARDCLQAFRSECKSYNEKNLNRNLTRLCPVLYERLNVHRSKESTNSSTNHDLNNFYQFHSVAVNTILDFGKNPVLNEFFEVVEENRPERNILGSHGIEFRLPGRSREVPSESDEEKINSELAKLADGGSIKDIVSRVLQLKYCDAATKMKFLLEKLPVEYKDRMYDAYNKEMQNEDLDEWPNKIRKVRLDYMLFSKKK